MSIRLSTENCLYCIDGLQPAGRHPILGLVYRNCDPCATAGAYHTCPGCDNTSMFPADYCCLHHLDEHLAQRHLMPVRCPACGGVTDAIPFDPIPGEEPPW